MFVGNVSRGTSEVALLTLFNSVDGVYEDREPNVVAAVNFAYSNGEFSGVHHC